MRCFRHRLARRGERRGMVKHRITIAAGNGLKLGGLTSSQLTLALADILAHHCATGAREDRYRGLG
jgi:hypothetical protein